MIEITQLQLQQVRELEMKMQMRGVTMSTKVVYELWPALYGVKKRPNGCNACLRADINKFLSTFKELELADSVKIITDSQENNNEEHAK